LIELDLTENTTFFSWSITFARFFKNTKRKLEIGGYVCSKANLKVEVWRIWRNQPMLIWFATEVSGDICAKLSIPSRTL
jgi:hypothetical protein